MSIEGTSLSFSKPEPALPEVQERFSLETTGSNRPSSRLQPPESLAFLPDGRGDAKSGENWLKGFVGLLVSIGIVSASKAKTLLDTVFDARVSISNTARSIQEDPHTPRVNRETGEVYVGNPGRGTFDVIWEAGPLSTGGGDGGGPVNRTRRTGGGDEDDGENVNPDDPPNAGSVRRNQANWAARVVSAIVAGEVAAEDVVALVATLNVLGEKIDIKHRIAIITAAVDFLGGGRVAPGLDLYAAADQMLTQYDLDQALRPFVVEALSEELRGSESDGATGAVNGGRLVAFLYSTQSMMRVQARLLDAINGFKPNYSGAYGAVDVYNSFTAARDLYRDAFIEHMRSDGYLYVGDTAIAPPLSSTDLMLFRAAVRKQDKAGNIRLDANGNIDSKILDVILTDFDISRRGLGLDRANAVARETVLAAFPEASAKSLVAPIGSQNPEPWVRASIHAYFSPANQASAGFLALGDSMMESEIAVEVVLTNANGERFFAVLLLDGAQSIETICDGETVHDVFRKGEWEIEILRIPDVPDNQVKDLKKLGSVTPFPDWEPGDPE